MFSLFCFYINRWWKLFSLYWKCWNVIVKQSCHTCVMLSWLSRHSSLRSFLWIWIHHLCLILTSVEKKLNTPPNGVSRKCSSNFKQAFNSLGLCEVYWCQDRKITLKKPGVHSLRFFFLKDLSIYLLLFSATSAQGNMYFDYGAASFSNISMKDAIQFAVVAVHLYVLLCRNTPCLT